MRNQKPVSDDQNYALDFFTSKTVLSRSIDFAESLTRGLLLDVVFREINRRLDLRVRDNRWANLVDNEYPGPKVLF